MLSGKEIKMIKSLGEKKYRDSLGLFVVEGDKMLREAIDSGLEIEYIIKREEVGEQIMSKLSTLSSPSPVLAVVRKPKEKPLASPSGLCLGLDTIRDPGNLGTIMRIADWFGIFRIYASPDTVEMYNPKVIQASMGTIFRKEVIYCDLPSLCQSFTAASLPVYGTFLNGENIYTNSLCKEGLIIMGNEANGISDRVASLVNKRLTIPSFALGRGAESLNVAAATAVVLSEFCRR